MKLSVRYLSTGLNFLEYSFRGIFEVYKRIIIYFKVRVFHLTIREFTYGFIVLVGALMTIPGWKSYQIELNKEVIMHTISTDDFLIYLIGYGFMSMPLIVKMFRPHSGLVYRQILFLAGLIINALFYFLTIISTDRIAPVKEAKLTLYFYLFGVFLLISGIMGVLGFIVKPSTHLRFSRH